MHIRGLLLLMVFTWPGRVPGVVGLVWIRVYMSAYTAHRAATAKKCIVYGEIAIKHYISQCE